MKTCTECGYRWNGPGGCYECSESKLPPFNDSKARLTELREFAAKYNEAVRRGPIR